MNGPALQIGINGQVLPVIEENAGIRRQGLEFFHELLQLAEKFVLNFFIGMIDLPRDVIEICTQKVVMRRTGIQITDAVFIFPVQLPVPVHCNIWRTD